MSRTLEIQLLALLHRGALLPMQPRGQQRRAMPGTMPLRSTAAWAGATDPRFPWRLDDLVLGGGGDGDSAGDVVNERVV